MRWDGRALNVPSATRSAFDRADYARLIVVDGEVYCLDNRDNIIPMGGTSNPDIGDPNIAQAINVIQSTYGDTVSVKTKAKNLVKFGGNEAVGTTIQTLQDFPTGILNESYVSSNIIGLAVSTSGSDTFTMGVEGHTIDGAGNFTFGVQEVVLNGTTPVTLGTPLARCTRLVNKSASDNVGVISVSQPPGS